MQIIVFGAGAVGSTIGGLLALNRNEVVLVGRKDHVREISAQEGLRMRSGTGEYFAPLTAVESDPPVSDGACILFTPKSYSTESCLDQLKGTVPEDTPIVSLQNGVTNEEMIADHFPNVFGGVCKMTCSFLHPGRVTFRKIGRIVIGKYPKGADPFARKLVQLFEDAGFTSTASRSIMCDKWLKLVTNLQSTFNAIVEIRDHESIEFMKLKVGIIEEARRVLKADKIRAKSCDGRDQSFEEMIRSLQKPRAQRSTGSLRVNNSTWQNLYLKRSRIENEYFHQPVIDLGASHGIPVPFNQVALEKVMKSHEEQLGPESFRAADILEEIQKRIEKQ